MSSEIISSLKGAETFVKDTSKKTGVSERTVQQEIQIDKHLKKERKEKILSMYLACYSQQEIADEVKISKMDVSRAIEALCNFSETLPNCYKHDILFENSLLQDKTYLSFL
ncbi:MAG: hypothetical protein KKA19_09030 [Candidatus Margulisbacteria bacterium]|nr:hypothetical protein [Candidatus Margulisiibacteriota bacterium]